MTHLYYVRHAQPDYSVHDDLTRPLTEKGMRDCALVTDFLTDKSIDRVFSSPYKRAVDTVQPFAAQAHLRPAAAQTSSVLPMRKVFHKNVVYNP